MVEKRKDLKSFEPYKLDKIATYNLGDNENRLIDWSDLMDEALEKISVEDLNFYGDNRYRGILQDYAAYVDLEPENLVQGVGSDQMIQTVITTFLAAEDRLVTLAPDFFMYGVFSAIHGVSVSSYSLQWDKGRVQFDPEDLVDYAHQVGAKMILLSNPNNPASFAFQKEDLESLVQSFSGLVVVDEAYIEFAQVESMVPLVKDYDNLIVLRTLSKAFGLAGLRLGFALSSPHLAREIDMVLAPYSMPNIVGKIGSTALENQDRVQQSVLEIRQIRDAFISFLQERTAAEVMESQTNFVTFRLPYGKELHQKALQEDMSFKYYEEGPLTGYIRLTIGRKEEMELIKQLIVSFEI